MPLALSSRFPSAALAAAGNAPEPILVAGIPLDFILFALTLLGVALFHHHTFNVAMTGLAAIVAYKLAFTGFKTGPASLDYWATSSTSGSRSPICSVC